MQVVEVHVTPVPWHTPPVQTSPYVHRLPSSQAALTRHCHVPPVLVQVYDVPSQVRTWQAVDELQVCEVPPVHVPSARFAPQPSQLRPVVMVTPPQTSAQVPAAVPQPDPAEQVTEQHWLPPPTAQVVVDAEHAQVLHVSPVPLQ